MDPRNALRSKLVAFLLSLAVALFAASAVAQKADATAKALQKKAMEEDYLATEFAKAQEKLEKAIQTCGDKCPAPLRATLHRDLGVVQIGGQLDRAKGIDNFVQAIKLDPKVELDKDLKTKELEAAFAEAKKKAAGGGGAAPPPAGGGGATDQPSGDFDHTPAAEQQVRTPIPVYVEYSGEEQLTRVIARYKGFGMTDWKTVELKKMGEKGWGGLIPCADVQQGNTLYYLQGFDANNDVVATAGDRNNPYKVPVTREPVAEPPALPGASPPTQCADTGDCPPNFPGCKKGPGPTGPSDSTEPVGKEGGAFCEEDSECQSGKCDDNKCTEPERKDKAPKFWIGIMGSVDYSFVPSAEQVCTLHPPNTPNEGYPINDANYYCVEGSTDYPSRTDAAQNASILDPSVQGSGNRVNGGGALGNIRLNISIDYALNTNMLLGARLGYVLLTYPGEAAAQDGKRWNVPIHFELRATYVFGKDPLANAGFAPYVFGGAGLAPFETRVSVKVGEQPAGGGPRTQREVDSWHIAGPAFLAFGGGGRLALSPKSALMLGLRAHLAFGNAFAFGAAPEVGVAFGF